MTNRLFRVCSLPEGLADMIVFGAPRATPNFTLEN